MKNVTITLDEETAKWARVWAAQQGKSVSAALAELLYEKRMDSIQRSNGLERFSFVSPRELGERKPYPTRDELYER